MYAKLLARVDSAISVNLRKNHRNLNRRLLRLVSQQRAVIPYLVLILVANDKRENAKEMTVITFL